MTILHAIILGIVEGLTEFLPVSSTAHLIITSQFLGLSQTEFMKFFEVFIQSGAILTVFFLYLKYLLKNKQVIKFILISFLPTAVIGLFLYKIIKNIFFKSNLLIVFTLAFVGVLFLIIEFLIKRKKIALHKTINHLTINHALFIGLFQSLAVIPGVSRAGIIIIGMILLGYKRQEAAKYTFLLAVPTILAATGLDFVKTIGTVSIAVNEILLLVVGFFTSFLVAYFIIKWFINYLQNNSLVVFGIYRIILAIILLQII